MHSSRGFRKVALAIAAVSACVTIAGCSRGADTPGTEPSSTAGGRETEGASTSSATVGVTVTETFAEPKGSRDLQKVREKFGPLASESFFDHFSSCDSNGIPDSYACTGPEVGQFQFFAGDAKAASTTQLLTELRSSRVVEDSGDRIVGWSTLGTTAVITVVDNKRGLTMQQMVSSDKQDPRQRIRELGLVKEESTTPQPSPTPTSSGRETPTPRS